MVDSEKIVAVCICSEHFGGTNFAKALRARPAKRPCSAPRQNLRGPGIVPGVDVV